MRNPLKIVMFYPSVCEAASHSTGNFISGIIKTMQGRGHEVQLLVPENLYPEGDLKIPPLLRPCVFWYNNSNNLKLNWILAKADLVLVQEKNDPALIARIGAHRSKQQHAYALFFHDTSFKALKDTNVLGTECTLQNYDGILTGCDTLRDMYLAKGLASRAWTWEMTVDTNVFYPQRNTIQEGDLVWIGNWGDEIRSSSLEEFLIKPVTELGLRAKVYGSSYPHEALQRLAEAGISYGGYLPYHRFPEIFARYKATIHIPNRPASGMLKHKPAIRIFEALSCGIPLIASSWNESDTMFTPGKELLLAHSGQEMKKHLNDILTDSRRAQDLTNNGMRTMNRHYSCSHRVTELEQLVIQFRQQKVQQTATDHIETYAS